MVNERKPMTKQDWSDLVSSFKIDRNQIFTVMCSYNNKQLMLTELKRNNCEIKEVVDYIDNLTQISYYANI